MNKEYITTKELHEMTGIGINKCKEILSEIKKEMLEKGMYVPYEKKLLIPLKLVRKKLKI